jgi:ribonuclease HII
LSGTVSEAGPSGRPATSRKPSSIPAAPRLFDAAAEVPKDPLAFEKVLWARGIRSVAGVDEAGRGALFGPVVAAAVVLDTLRDLSEYRDSKTLSEPRREALYEKLLEDGHTWAVGLAPASEIDRTDILRATLRAMASAVSSLRARPDWVLVDGPHRPLLPCGCDAIVAGDARSVSIACASIVAKVTRDRLMRVYEEEFPGYGLARHKGYGTRQHLEALRKLGPTPLHRCSFSGVTGGTA